MIAIPKTIVLAPGPRVSVRYWSIERKVSKFTVDGRTDVCRYLTFAPVHMYLIIALAVGPESKLAVGVCYLVAVYVVWRAPASRRDTVESTYSLLAVTSCIDGQVNRQCWNYELFNNNQKL